MRYKLLIALLFLLSCNGDHENTTSTTTNSDNSSKTVPFHKFLEKFGPVQLPYIFSITSNDTGTIYKLRQLSSKSDDTLFIKPDGMDDAYCFGYLADTSKFYGLIFIFPADNYYPVLATYTKTGNLISRENILANGCSMDCGLTYYSETGIINKDYSIFCSDTDIWEYLCNSDGKPIPHTAQRWVFLKQGSIKNDGSIFIDTTKPIKTVTKL